jgi:hypothetical protein
MAGERSGVGTKLFNFAKYITGNGKSDSSEGDDGQAELPPIPVPKLIDREKPRTDIRPGDLLNAPPPPSWADKQLYEFVVEDCWKKARDARIHWEMGWSISLEFYNGNQWFGLDQTSRNILNYRDMDDNPRRFTEDNQLQPRLDAVVSMVTQAAPASKAIPVTPALKDRQAAVEANGVIANYNLKFDNDSQVREWAEWPMKHTTAFLKSTFEPGELVQVPIMGTDEDDDTTQLRGSTTPGEESMLSREREIVGVETKPLGDIEERIIPGARVYGDPWALKVDDWRWLIHTELYPLSWYQQHFENGFAVEPDPGGGVIDYADRGTKAGISASLGLAMTVIGKFAPAIAKDVATCYEMWILPGKLVDFPHGALIRCAGGQVLRPRITDKEAEERNKPKNGMKDPTPDMQSTKAWSKAFKVKFPDSDSGDEDDPEAVTLKRDTYKRVQKIIPGNYLPWPYDCTTEFPFVPLSWAVNPDSAYGFNIIQGAQGLQQSYNRTLMRILERLEKDKPVCLRPMLDGAGSDKLEDMGLYQELKWDFAKGKPDWFVQPQIAPEQFKMLELIKLDLDDIFGIHDPNFRGEVSADASGVAIQGLKQGDASRLSKYSAAIKHAVQRRDTWRIRHASQFFGVARLMGMDQTGNPASKPGAMDPAAIHMPFHVSHTPVTPMGRSTQPSTSTTPLSPPNSMPMPGSSVLPSPIGSIAPTGPTSGMGNSPGPSPTNAPPPPNPNTVTDDTGNPYANIMSFEALTSGGQVRIMVEPSSAIADTPDARNQRLERWYAMGIMGPPQSPAANKIFVQLTKDNDSDILLSRLTELQDRMDMEAALNAPPPPPPPPPIPDPVQMATLNSQLAIAEYKAKSEADTASKIAIANAAAALPIKPTVSLQAKADPSGTLAIEEEVGLDVHGASSHMATVAAIAPDVAHHYGAGPTPTQQKDLAEHAAAVGAASNIVGAQHQAGIADAGAMRDHEIGKDAAEHGAGLTAAQNAQQSDLQQDQLRTQAELAPPKPKPAESG